MSREQFFEAFTIARSMGFAVSENIFLSKYLFFNFHILTKTFRNLCYVNKDFNYKINHLYYFLHENYLLTKIFKTGHSENKIKRETGSNQDFEI